MTARRFTAFAALGLFAAVALAGCSTPGGAPEADSDEPTAEAPDEGLTTDAGGDCLVGDWVITQEEMQGFYDAIGGESDVAITVEGSTSLDFTTSSYEYLPAFGIRMDVSGIEATGDVTGSVRGDYSVEGDVITTVNDVSDIALQVTAMGVPIDASAIGNEIISSHPINSVTYHCEDGEPVIDFITASSTHAVRLTAG